MVEKGKFWFALIGMKKTKKFSVNEFCWCCFLNYRRTNQWRTNHRRCAVLNATWEDCLNAKVLFLNQVLTDFKGWKMLYFYLLEIKKFCNSNLLLECLRCCRQRANIEVNVWGSFEFSCYKKWYFYTAWQWSPITQFNAKNICEIVAIIQNIL